jgi:hypothetical protein
MAAKARTLCSPRTGRVARALIWWTVCVPFLLAQGFTGSHSLFASNGSADKLTAKKSLQAVAKILFEADVHLAAGDEGRARELYTKAVAPGPFSTSYMYAYLAAEEQSEQLFCKIEAAKKGYMPALLQALDQLYLGRADFYTDPLIAWDLYQTAKKANPKGTFEQEEDVASLLKMAVAAGPFDTAAFFKKHSLARQKFEDGEGAIPTMRKNKEPYALWEMAESASVDGSHGQADGRLVLQLVARGPATLSERLSAVTAAHKTWMSGRQSGFKLLDHIGPEKAAEYAERRLPSQDRQMDFDVEAAVEEEDRRLAHLQEFFKDPRSFEIPLGFVSSDDGKLRGRTWSSALRGTSATPYSIGQFQAPNGTVGIAGFEPWTHRIETVITNTKQRVYLSFSSSVVSRHSHKSTVEASSVTDAGNKSVPFFKTKKESLTEITLWQRPEEPAEIKFSKANGGTLLIPLISDNHEFSGKFLKYVFDGTCFNYSGVQ